jgi:hypothetical protein
VVATRLSPTEDSLFSSPYAGASSETEEFSGWCFWRFAVLIAVRI